MNPAKSKWRSEAYKKSVKKETDMISAGSARFSAIDLSGIVIGRPHADLPELKAKDLAKANLHGVNFSFLELTGKMSHASFEDMQFLYADIQNASFKESRLTSCDFSQSVMNVQFERSMCQDTQFMHVEFKGSPAFEFSGKDSEFRQCNFNESRFQTLQFINACFYECDFSKTNFTDIIFLKSEFRGCNFSHTVMQNLQFNDSVFTQCDFTQARFNTTPSKSSKFIQCTFQDTQYIG